MKVSEVIQSWCEQNSTSFEYFDSIDSTNSIAKQNAMNESSPFVLYFAKMQTAGRGRGSNTWLNPGDDSGILATFSYHVDRGPQPIAPAVLGLCVHRAMSNCWPKLAWSIKPPNDILISGKKTAGILTEVVQQNGRFRLLIGLGFNLLAAPENMPQATHLTAPANNTILDEHQLHSFMDWLVSDFDRVLHQVCEPQMSSQICNELTAAINSNPLLNREQKLLSVSPEGNLTYLNRSVNWMEL